MNKKSQTNLFAILRFECTSDPICEKCVFVIRSLKLNRSGYHICHLSILFIIQIDRGESQVNTYVFEYYNWICFYTQIKQYITWKMMVKILFLSYDLYKVYIFWLDSNHMKGEAVMWVRVHSGVKLQNKRQQIHCTFRFPPTRKCQQNVRKMNDQSSSSWLIHGLLFQKS